ncbi:murein biosynthesis integral membrane protein MurJ [Propioniciclava sp.]|uniref:murein biosynthesis integral membrane protein MurJ n=1 Tax=Propioniciclava sp. TaxID=2038686 RepID=UPI002620234C|nr:murein biosynthesis integral membrane protein MurJ [Propioniciclava sp.]
MADGGSTPAASSRRLLDATAVMASGTLLSRILGFAKALLLVVVLGAGTPLADAYSAATLVPNSLYMIFAGGALNTVLVPQIVRHIRNDPDAGEAFINRIMTAFLVLLAGVTVVATLLTGPVMSVWTGDAWRSPAMATHWQQLLLLATLTMPQLFFFGAFFLIGQVLNARDRFGPMMWAPILNNVVGIAVLGAYVALWGANARSGVPFTNDQVYLLGLGSTLGIVLQTVALVPAMASIGFRYRPRWDLKGQGLMETFHLAKWMLGYVLLTMLVQTVVTRLATNATGSLGTADPGATVEAAGLTAYQTAYTVWILPHSLLTVSLATAMLPSASRLAAARDLPGVAAETLRTLRLATTFIVLGAFGFVALALPFTRLAFGHGANATAWVFIGWTLVAFAFGLVPYTIQYLYLRGYYALEDTRTPFFIQLAISVVNIALAYAFTALDHDPARVAPWLALAYSLSYLVGAVITHLALKRRLPDLSGAALLGHLRQLAAAALPGSLIAFAVSWWILGRDSLVVQAVAFLVAAGIAVVSFFFVAKRLGIAETTQLAGVLRRRSPGTTSSEDPTLEANDLAVDGSGQAPGTPPVAQVFDEAPLLAYPDPDDPNRTPASDIPDGVLPVGHVQAGQVLDGRYRLDEPLARRGGTLTWLGFDTKLSRRVLLHVMHPDEPRALEILDQAQRSAPAVHARFLRVWDAVLVEDRPHGSYIVCEYAPGQSLELALRHGRFSDVEAAWVVREVASGLVAMHAQGLYHRQLNPDTVVVTASGNVKIVGFLVENALHPTPHDSDGEVADVLALGELLYALMVARWPGGPGYGLPGAPRDAGGRLLLPRQVSPRVSTELSAIVDRILSRTPKGGASRLRTAQEIAHALGHVLRGQDASRSLEQRLRYPVAPVKITAPRAPRPSTEANATHSAAVTAHVPPPLEGDDALEAPQQAAPMDFTAVSPSLRGNPNERPALPGRSASSAVEPDLDLRREDVDDAEESTATFLFGDDEPEEGTASITPIPPPAASGNSLNEPPEPSRAWQGYLLGLFAVTLAMGLVMVFQGAFEQRTAEPVEFAIVAARDFDPSGDGGDDTENPDLAHYAADGDLATAWTTERYGRTPTFNNRKPGAGVVVDLGEPREVAWVAVVLGDGATTGEIRVPTDASVAAPPVESIDQWTQVAAFGPASGEVTVQLLEKTTTRFVLVYLTQLPRVEPNYQGSIHEIRVGN